jgi:hypothetical protein
MNGDNHLRHARELSEPPAFLKDNLPEDIPEPDDPYQLLWTVTGKDREEEPGQPRRWWQRKEKPKEKVRLWRYAYTTKEACLKDGCKSNECWVWLGAPPTQITRTALLHEAYKNGDAGVVVLDENGRCVARWEL